MKIYFHFTARDRNKNPFVSYFKTNTGLFSFPKAAPPLFNNTDGTLLLSPLNSNKAWESSKFDRWWNA